MPNTPETSEITGTEEVTLQDMLDARERRAMAQRRLLNSYGCPLICLTLNIPGPVKVPPLAPAAFLEGCRRIEEGLKLLGLKPCFKEEVREKTGWEAIYCVSGEPEAIKAKMAAAEDRDRLGRLFDIDVIRLDGSKVSREELGLSPRACLLCGRPAHQCSRSRSHSLKELSACIHQILSEGASSHD